MFAQRKSKTKGSIRFLLGDHDEPIEAEIGDSKTVLEVALANEIPLGHSCGGMGSCTTCLGEIQGDLGKLPPRGDTEQEMADMKGLKPRERLCCQLPAVAGLVVRLRI
jgi:ferredoxin